MTVQDIIEALWEAGYSLDYLCSLSAEEAISLYKEEFGYESY